MQRCMVYSTPLVCSWARVCNKPWAPLPLELVCSKPTNYEMRYSNIYNDYSVMNKYGRERRYSSVIQISMALFVWSNEWHLKSTLVVAFFTWLICFKIHSRIYTIKYLT